MMPSRYLQELANLVRLAVDNTAVSEAALATLAGKFPKLVIVRDGEEIVAAELTKNPIEVRSGPDVSDASLSTLQNETHLKVLTLTDCPAVTDESAPVIAKLRRLRQLTIGGTKITSDGIGQFAELPVLEHLALPNSSEVDDQAIGQISRIENLESLTQTKMTPETMPYLSRLRYLNRLVLDDAQLTNQSFQHPGGLSQLKNLNCQRVPIGDAALIHLQFLMKLDRLNLSGTRVAASGKDQLPDTTIETSPEN